MSVISAQIHVSKKSSNNLSAVILNKHMKEISEACKNRTTASGVNCLADELVVTEENKEKVYSFIIKAARPIQRSESQAKKSMAEAVKFIKRAAEHRGWTAKDAADLEEQRSIAADRVKFEVPELNVSAISKYFSGIYERESHIRIIQDSVVNAVKTNFEDRAHILLYGQPAVAKTVLMKRFKKLYEGDNDIERVAVINSTTLSKAGLENWLLEKAKDKVLPEILFFDELEKFNPDNMLSLLSIMDETGQIARMNSRIGRQVETAKPLIVASCNDEQKLKSFASGALWSRFAFKLFCARPKRELMRQILLNILKERQEQGDKVNPVWADIIINYAFDTLKCDDPREIKAMLAGRERLETGEFIKDLESIKETYIKSSCEMGVNNV